MDKIKILLPLLLFLLLPYPVFAQTKIYEYDLIDTKITVNQDSTFDVEESQTFNFTGNFHKVFRSSPLHRTDNISDILVIDGTKNVNLTYSDTRRDPLNPLNKDHFTYYKDRNNEVIEWYYDLSNITHTWIIHYKVHGGIEFDKSSDRLYWNIFSGFDVPIKQAQVVVVLPGSFDLKSLPIYSYRTINKRVEQKISQENHSISFVSSEFSPSEALTIDISWPKGVINKSSYWLDFTKIYYGYIFSAIIIFISIITIFLFWLLREKIPEGKGTIVPEYKPPENLRPAIAEVITKEKLTAKGFAATIIDLAVRGYVKVEEKKKSKITTYILVSIVTLVVLIFFVSLFLNTSGNFVNFGLSQNAVEVAMVLSGVLSLILVISSPLMFKSLLMPDYVLTSLKPHKDDPKLLGYEKKYLALLFSEGDKFSTEGLRNSSRSTKLEFYNKTKEIKDDIYEEAEMDTKAFAVDLIAEKKKNVVWTGLGITLFILLYGQLRLGIGPNQFEALLVSIIASSLGLWSYIRYEARLNEEGRILREEWLGFKLYLEVAEKYRMQQLTPDLFEKYLPYAMIFGVEKKWAKAFDSLNMPPPRWYYGGYYGHGYTGTSTGASFSPSGFSASFSSSFSSSFASSGAGGGGGGGGAGGGGGGGGGGAS